MEIYELIIIGAGPAGLAASIYAQERKLKTLILEADEIGGQPMRLYPDKNIYDFPSYIQIKSRDLMNQMIDHSQNFGAKILENKTVKKILAKDNNFNVIIENQKGFISKAIILATGIGHYVPRKLEIHNEKIFTDRFIFYQKLPENIAGKKIVIVGGGDTALETALQASENGASVTVVHRRDKFRAQENSVEKAKKKSIDFLLESQVIEICGIDRLENLKIKQLNGNIININTDYLIICIGMELSVELLQNSNINANKQAVSVDCDMQTSIKGIFACGDIIIPIGKFKRITNALGSAATAVNGAYQYIKNPYWAKK